jgi:hypothetical protein
MGDETVRYFTFNTDDAAANQDTWQTTNEVAMTISSFNPFAFARADITVDENDVPHVWMTDEQTDMGQDRHTMWYNNKIGGSWNGTNIEVDGITNNKNFSVNPSWAVVHCNPSSSSPNALRPCVITLESTADEYVLYYGNATDATSFTATVIDSNPPGTSDHVAVSVLPNGNMVVSDRHSTTSITTYHHTFANSLIEANWTSKTVTPTNQIGDAPRLFSDSQNKTHMIFIDIETSPTADRLEHWEHDTSWTEQTVLQTIDGLVGDVNIAEENLRATRPTYLHYVYDDASNMNYGGLELSNPVNRVVNETVDSTEVFSKIMALVRIIGKRYKFEGFGV